MNYDTVIGEVQNRAGLDSREDALRAARITLETVSERVDPGAADDVAAQLPDEIGRHLSKVDEVETFDWDEFVTRVEEKGDYDPQDEEADAVNHARVVMDVVDDAVTGDVLEDVRAELPNDDWENLFEFVDQDEVPVDEEQRPQ